MTSSDSESISSYNHRVLLSCSGGIYMTGRLLIRYLGDSEEDHRQGLCSIQHIVLFFRENNQKQLLQRKGSGRGMKIRRAK